jgi:hypothetical protein
MPKKSPGIKGQERLLKRQNAEVMDMQKSGTHLLRPIKYKQMQERASKTAKRLRDMRRAAGR